MFPQNGVPDHIYRIIKEVSFVDDAALALVAKSDLIVSKVKTLIEGIDSICLSFGLVLNLADPVLVLQHQTLQTQT